MIYLELFITFLKIGAFTFGGGYAMLPLIQEQVIANNWISNEKLINFIAISESTPGPFAINISTYIGTQTGGILGALCAILGVVFPSFVIILIVAKCFTKFQESKVVKGVISGLRPAVVGLIATAVLSTGKMVFFSTGISNFINFQFISSLIVFGIMMILALKKINPILIIIFSAILGIISGYLQSFI